MADFPSAAGYVAVSLFVKDDSSSATIAVYYVLLCLFFCLALFGIANLVLVCKIKKLSKQVVTFYVVSETVVTFRVLLFTDPFLNWSDYSYVIIFTAMPSFLYLFVGLSQVMLTFESIMKIQNHKVRQEESIMNVNLK